MLDIVSPLMHDWIKGASRPNPSQIAQNKMVRDMNKMSVPFSELGYFRGKIVAMNL